MPTPPVRVTSSHSFKPSKKETIDNSSAKGALGKKIVRIGTADKNGGKLFNPSHMLRDESFRKQKLANLSGLGAEWQIEPYGSIAKVNLPLQTVFASLDEKAKKAQIKEAEEFIEKGYNELVISIKKEMLPSLEKRIAEIRKARDSQDSYLGPDENTLKKIELYINKFEGWDSLESKPKNRGLAYQIARHIETSIKAVDEALKLGQMNARIGDLSQWHANVTNEFLQKNDFFKKQNKDGTSTYEPRRAMKQLSSSWGQKLMTNHLTMQRTEVMNELNRSNNQLCSLWAKMDRYDREVSNTNHFSMSREIIGDIQRVVRVNAKEFRGNAGRFKDPKKAWGYETFTVTQKPTFAETVIAIFKHSNSQASQAMSSLTKALGKLPSDTLGALKKLPQQASMASHVAGHWRDVPYKKMAALWPGTISAPSTLSGEEQKVKSIVRSMYWLMQQPALRMQYDFNPLQAAAIHLKKDKPLDADFTTEAMQDIGLTFTIDDMVTGKASGQNQADPLSKMDKATQKSAFRESCDKAIKASDDILKQIDELPDLMRQLIDSQKRDLSSWGQDLWIKNSK